VFDDIARRAAEPAEKLLTTSFRLAGWLAGRAVSPVLVGLRTVAPPVVDTVARLSPAAAGLIGTLLPPGCRRPPAADRPTTADPGPADPGPANPGPANPGPADPGPAKPARLAAVPHIATVPTAAGGPSPAAAHAAAEAGPQARTPASSGELPIANWDGLTVAAIRQRTRSLTAGQVRQLLAYEHAHAARPAVLLNLENRLAKATATP
jgi:hypothetical protein